MSTNLVKRKFNNVDVTFRFNTSTGQSEVKIDEIAKFCGWTKIATSGNEVIRWSRVNEKLAELCVSKLGHGDFLPEYIMYPLIGKANNERATQFMLWVGMTLVELRTKGVVIMDNATDETIDFEKKFGIYRIRKTFLTTKDIAGDYKQFTELCKVEWKAKHIDNNQRIKLSNIICEALEIRLADNMNNLKGSEMLGIREIITDIKNDIIKLGNKKHGGIKTGQTKQIKKLEHELTDKLTDALKLVED
jgi:hypothetical protein